MTDRFDYQPHRGRADDMQTSLFLARRGIEASYQYYVRVACPCAFPRFLQLVRFKHEDCAAIAVACLDQNYMISLCTGTVQKLFDAFEPVGSVYEAIGPRKSLGGSDAQVWRCKVCRTECLLIENEYSISFRRSYMVFPDPFAPTLGARPQAIFPLAGGVYGPLVKELKKCRSIFRPASEFEMYQYLTEMRSGVDSVA